MPAQAEEWQRLEQEQYDAQAASELPDGQAEDDLLMAPPESEEPFTTPAPRISVPAAPPIARPYTVQPAPPAISVPARPEIGPPTITSSPASRTVAMPATRPATVPTAAGAPMLYNTYAPVTTNPSQHHGSPAEYFYDNYRLRFDYGGWLFSTFANYHNIDHSSLPDAFNYASDHQLRLYGKWTNEAGNTAYLRLRAGYSDVRQNAGYQGVGSDFSGPAVDLAYWRYALPALPYFPTSAQHRAEMTLGRQFFRLGRGLAFANRMDGGKLDYHTAWWDFSLFALRTVPGTDNIDPTVPGGGRSAHNALGFTIDYSGFRDHNLYLFYANVRDSSRENPNDDAQEYDYDPVYVGFGATGQAATNLKYWFEYVNQTGWSFVTGSEQNRERIHAHAYDVGLQQFLPNLRGKPSFLLQYLSATGDGDRGLALGTAAGNLYTSHDHAFNYFGYAPLGLAWDPKLTNLEVWKAGATVQPLRLAGLADHDATLALTYLRFERNRPDGMISDWSAIPPDKLANLNPGSTHLGHEIDLSLTAALFPGTTVNANFGYFKPGRGFLNLDNTNNDFRRAARYFSVGLTQEF